MHYYIFVPQKQTSVTGKRETLAAHSTLQLALKMNPLAEDTTFTALLEKCKATAQNLGEKGGSFVVLDGNANIVASSFIGNDQNKTAAVCKGNTVVADGSDKKLWNPAEKFGSCGLCYVCCGCICCDFNMLIGAMCCTKKLHLLGAVPIRGTDGLVGALCVAGAGGSASNDKKIAVESLKGAGWTLGEDGVWTQGGKVVEDMERA